MSKFLRKQERRLQRRQAGSNGADKTTTLPGSMNAHKTAADGHGKRTKSRIHADSRQATI